MLILYAEHVQKIPRFEVALQMEAQQTMHDDFKLKKQGAIQAQTWHIAPFTALQQAQNFEGVDGERTRPEAGALRT